MDMWGDRGFFFRQTLGSRLPEAILIKPIKISKLRIEIIWEFTHQWMKANKPLVEAGWGYWEFNFILQKLKILLMFLTIKKIKIHIYIVVKPVTVCIWLSAISSETLTFEKYKLKLIKWNLIQLLCTVDCKIICS